MRIIILLTVIILTGCSTQYKAEVVTSNSALKSGEVSYGEVEQSWPTFDKRLKDVTRKALRYSVGPGAEDMSDTELFNGVDDISLTIHDNGWYGFNVGVGHGNGKTLVYNTNLIMVYFAMDGTVEDCDPQSVPELQNLGYSLPKYPECRGVRPPTRCDEVKAYCNAIHMDGCITEDNPEGVRKCIRSFEGKFKGCSGKAVFVTTNDYNQDVHQWWDEGGYLDVIYIARRNRCDYDGDKTLFEIVMTEIVRATNITVWPDDMRDWINDVLDAVCSDEALEYY